MTAYVHWTPATDTHELRMDLRGPYWETETMELRILDLYPPTVTTRVVRWSWADVFRRLGGFVALMVFLLALSATPAQARPGGPEKDNYHGPSAAAADVREFFNGFWSVTR